jgi:heme/copper-type cytochrome/quinol oxidase subunit 2
MTGTQPTDVQTGSATDQNASKPATGDTFNMLLWISLMVVAATVIIVMIILIAKRRKRGVQDEGSLK